MRGKNYWPSKAENCTRFARILLLWIFEIRFDVHQRFHEKPLSLVVTLQTESAFHPIIVDKSNPMTSWRGTFSFQHSGEAVNKKNGTSHRFVSVEKVSWRETSGHLNLKPNIWKTLLSNICLIWPDKSFLWSGKIKESRWKLLCEW